MPYGSSKNIESKLKALELKFDLDFKIKKIEDDLLANEKERDHQIAEKKNSLGASAQSLNSKI